MANGNSSSNDISTTQCTAFLDFFSSKINTIHQQLASSRTPSDDPPWMITSGQPLISSLSDFTPVTEQTVSELIRKAKTTTSALGSGVEVERRGGGLGPEATPLLGSSSAPTHAPPRARGAPRRPQSPRSPPAPPEPEEPP
ncbi:unnamed protein product [Boreogadus saida]